MIFLVRYWSLVLLATLVCVDSSLGQTFGASFTQDSQLDVSTITAKLSNAVFSRGVSSKSMVSGMSSSPLLTKGTITGTVFDAFTSSTKVSLLSTPSLSAGQVRTTSPAIEKFVSSENVIDVSTSSTISVSTKPVEKERITSLKSNFASILPSTSAGTITLSRSTVSSKGISTNLRKSSIVSDTHQEALAKSTILPSPTESRVANRISSTTSSDLEKSSSRGDFSMKVTNTKVLSTTQSIELKPSTTNVLRTLPLAGTSNTDSSSLRATVVLPNMPSSSSLLTEASNTLVKPSSTITSIASHTPALESSRQNTVDLKATNSFGSVEATTASILMPSRQTITSSSTQESRFISVESSNEKLFTTTKLINSSSTTRTVSAISSSELPTMFSSSYRFLDDKSSKVETTTKLTSVSTSTLSTNEKSAAFTSTVSAQQLEMTTTPVLPEFTQNTRSFSLQVESTSSAVTTSIPVPTSTLSTNEKSAAFTSTVSALQLEMTTTLVLPEFTQNTRSFSLQVKSTSSAVTTSITVSYSTAIQSHITDTVSITHTERLSSLTKIPSSPPPDFVTTSSVKPVVHVTPTKSVNSPVSSTYIPTLNGATAFQPCGDNNFYCNHHGQCFSNGNHTSKYCSCEKDYYGEKCENKYNEVYLKLVFGLAILCGLLLIGLMALCWHLHNKVCQYEEHKLSIAREERIKKKNIRPLEPQQRQRTSQHQLTNTVKNAMPGLSSINGGYQKHERHNPEGSGSDRKSSDDSGRHSIDSAHDIANSMERLVDNQFLNSNKINNVNSRPGPFTRHYDNNNKMYDRFPQNNIRPGPFTKHYEGGRNINQYEKYRQNGAIPRTNQNVYQKTYNTQPGRRNGRLNESRF